MKLPTKFMLLFGFFVSSSILINANLPELVAYTNAEYIEIVTRLTEPALLNNYKNTQKHKTSQFLYR
jgi:predicted O-linked N-acetylglucosamine transferase (SPINDLY family)